MSRIVDDLHEAAEIISDAVRSLNNSSRGCTACGLTVHNNQDEFRAHVELTAMVAKLQKWAAILGSDSEK